MHALHSSKALTGFLPAHERHHALVQLATSEQCVPWRQCVEHCIGSHHKFQGHPRARHFEPLDDLGNAWDHLMLMKLRPRIEPVAGLTDGEQGLVATSLVDGLTPDVQELAGLPSRKHAAGTLDQLLPEFNFTSEIERLGIELRHRRPDETDIGEDPGQRAEIGRCRHCLDKGGLVGPLGEPFDDVCRAPYEGLPNPRMPIATDHVPYRGLNPPHAPAPSLTSYT